MFEQILYISALLISLFLVLVTFIDHRNLAFLDRCIILDRLRDMSTSNNVRILSATRSRIIFTSRNVLYEIVISYQSIKVRSSIQRNIWTRYKVIPFEDMRDWLDEVIGNVQ